MCKINDFLKGAQKYLIIGICVSGFLVFSMLTSSEVYANKPIKVVVIDAGHGGHDPGAIGYSGANEKDIALAVALNVGKRISEAFPEIKVIYTRNTDVFVELKQRAIIANENNADYFISIHCNSAPNATSMGTETFVMGMDKNNANLAVAQRENASILLEANAEENYGNFNPTSNEAYIIFQLYQNVYSERSIHLAKSIQNEFSTRIHRKDRGVKQAPILVLWRTAMPSILVEVGFISNKEEEAYLVSKKGQDEIAKSIFNGFAKVAEGEGNKAVQGAIEKQEAPKPQATQTQEEIKQQVEETVKQNVKEQSNVNAQTNTQLPNANVCYKIQFLVSSTRQDLSGSKFAEIKDIEIEQLKENLYRYTSGHFSTYQEALAGLENIRNTRYKEAYIVAFDKNGQKISVNEAKNLEKSK
ncbi:MAG: N-acetylmuramoyl-L-alanine amidase [Bacteroidales bacterium]|nr:N-acetylmuramoyl-L-alanine amidase [Bacteroidales bacterium]